MSCVICIIAVITVFSSCSNKKVDNNSDVNDITFNGPYPQITVFSQTDDGTFASIEAVEGHAIVIYNKTTPYELAVEIIENLNGVILSSRHNSNYFLVEVGIGNENNFLSQIKQYKAVKFACYNSTSCNEDAIRSLTDNFNSEYNNGANATNSSFRDDYISYDNSGTKYLNQILEMINDNFNNAGNFEERHNYGSEYEYEYESENEYVNDDIIKIEGNEYEIVEYEEDVETSTSFNNNNANDIVVSRTKELFIATANGDIETIKRLLTLDFYRDNYPFSDEKKS